MDIKIPALEKRGRSVIAPAHLLIVYRTLLKSPPRSLREELQFRLFLIILAEGGISHAANLLDVSTSTLWRWMKGLTFPSKGISIDQIDVAFRASLKKLKLRELRGKRDARRLFVKEVLSRTENYETPFGTVSLFEPSKLLAEQKENYARTNDNQSDEQGGSGLQSPQSDDPAPQV